MGDEAEVQGVGLDELLDFLKDLGDDQRCWKQCRLWRDSEGGKKMCQPAMQLVVGHGVDAMRLGFAWVLPMDFDDMLRVQSTALPTR